MVKLKDLLDVDVLYGVGLILAFGGGAAWIGGFLSFLVPLAPFGALLILIGAVKSVANKLSK